METLFGPWKNDICHGVHFGELALFNPMRRRNATLVCYTETEFAILLKRDFEMLKEGLDIVKKQ